MLLLNSALGSLECVLHYGNGWEEEDHHRHRPWRWWGTLTLTWFACLLIDFESRDDSVDYFSRWCHGDLCGAEVAGGGGYWAHHDLRKRLHYSGHQECFASGNNSLLLLLDLWGLVFCCCFFMNSFLFLFGVWMYNRK